MLKNYITIAIRNFMRFKAYSFINILGLAIGMTCCILILAFIQDELSFDRFHTHADHIYRVIREERVGQTKQIHSGTSGALHAVLTKDFPELENAARLFRWGAQIKYGDKVFRENINAIDPAFLNIFDFPLIKGNKETAFSDPKTVIVSKRFAQKYFGQEDPIGKVITVEHQYFSGEYTVTAVIENAPPNSTLQFEILAATMTGEEARRFWEDWTPFSWRPVENYVLLKKSADKKELEQKLQGVILQYMGQEVATTNTYYLQPLTRTYLYSNADYGANWPWYSDISQVYLTSVIACFILAIACINFMNLATARASGRAREVGLRKVIGAHRKQLIGQFMGEAILMTCLALILSLGLVELFMPHFATFINKPYMSLNLLNDLPIFLGLIVVVGLLSGSYPAFFLSAFQPIETLKGTTKSGGTWLRKGLVVSQFALSILLIIGTAVIYQQLHFLRNARLGYNQEQVVRMSIFVRDRSLKKSDEPYLADRYNVVKQTLLQNPNISKATAFRPTLGWGWDLNRKIIAQDHESEDIRLPILEVDEDFIPFFEMELVSGRNFSLNIASDSTRAYILNEAAVQLFGWEDPIGKSFEWIGSGGPNRKGKVIGVVKDFNFDSLHKKVKPAVLAMRPRLLHHVAVKIPADKIEETMAFLEKTWFQFMPKNVPFEYTFLEEQFENIYYAEKRLGTMTTTFSGLAIFLSCLGLLGLVSYSAEQRRKEIGVRKVLGASVQGIVLLLSKDFIKLAIIANLIAWPVAYWATNQWLQNFAYQTNMGISPFLLGALLAALIAMASVSYQAIKAAHTNPVDALRNE